MTTATSPRIGSTELRDEWKIAGTIQAVLTLNIGKTAFLESDGSRERYWSVRGGGEFAQWLRGLAPRIAAPGSPFELDGCSAELIDLAYRAGLISQYVADQELMPTYRLKPDFEPCFAFDDRSAYLFTALQKERGFSSAATEDLREQLEAEGARRLQRAWGSWPEKRIRLSRYGLVQLLLECDCEGATLAPSFVTPVAQLGVALGPKGLAKRLLRLTGRTDPLYGPLKGFLELEAVRSRVIETSVQWEIVNRLLGWLIHVVNRQLPQPRDRSPCVGDDLLSLSFDPSYITGWRERATFTCGQDLPLRRRFLILRVDELRDQHGHQVEKPLNDETKKWLARLLDESPLIHADDTASAAAPRLLLAPQRDAYLAEVARGDRSTWDDEACLLSHDAAVVANLHPPELEIRLDCAIRYREYWLIVARALEYLCELRVTARLLQHETSDELETTMLAVSDGRLASRRQRAAVSFAAAATVILVRLRNASSPTAISATDALVSKLAESRQQFGIPEALEITGQNLEANQRVVAHYERLGAEERLVDLNAGLAFFTAALMGLTLPPFLDDIFGHETLASLAERLVGRSHPWILKVADVLGHQPVFELPWVKALALSWVVFTLLMICLALKHGFHHARWFRGVLELFHRPEPSKPGPCCGQPMSLLLHRAPPSLRVGATKPSARELWSSPQRLLRPDGATGGESTVSVRTGMTALHIHFECPDDAIRPGSEGLEEEVVVVEARELTVVGRSGDVLLVYQGQIVVVVRSPAHALPAEEIVALVAVGDEPAGCYVQMRITRGGGFESALVVNPGGRLTDCSIDRSWGGGGASGTARSTPRGWAASITLPYGAVASKPPRRLRANFYRIQRAHPRASRVIAAWSPLGAGQLDLHRTDRFGTIEVLTGPRARLWTAFAAWRARRRPPT